MGRVGPGSDTAERLQRQLEVAQQITHIGSWEWDLATGTVTWSDELYRIYGLEPRACVVTLDSFLERVHPSDRERVRRDVGAAIERGGRFAHRERIVRPDGSVRDLDTVGEVLRDGDQRAVALIGTCRDITEERRREETIRLYADVVDRVQIGLAVWRCDTPGDPAGLRLVAYNAAMEAATGVSLAGAVGKPLPAIFPAAMSTALPDSLVAVGDDAPLCELAAYAFGPPGPRRTFSAKCFVLPDACVGLALEDVTEKTRGERMQAGERRALELLAQGAPLHEILTCIASLLEELAPDTLASVLLLDESGERLLHGAAPSLPAAYNEAIAGSGIGPKAGSCGTAAFRREAVFVADVEADPLWADYRDLARPHGLRACWSTPILTTDGRPLGTFALYRRTPGLPSGQVRELLDRAAHVAAIAIERRSLDDRLRALSARMEAVREDERTGIAREIHDELGQALTAFKMDVAWLGRHLGEPKAVAAKLADMSALADEVIGAVRRISTELRPGVLDELGLEAAIEWQAEEFQRRTGTSCRLASTLGPLPVERGLATAVFRIFQEALTNVTRHAQATKVCVTLGSVDGELRLDVVDDGVGRPSAPRGGGLGLLGMQERARRFGGCLTITDAAPRGTAVSLTVPLRLRT